MGKMLKENLNYSNILGILCIIVTISPSDSVFGPEYGEMFGENEITRTDMLELEVQKLKVTIGALVETVTLLAEELNTLKDARGYDKRDSEHVYAPGVPYKRTSASPQKRMPMEYLGMYERDYGLPKEVGFHAFRSREASLTKGQTIVFDRVITNIGSAYSSGTGQFVCPRAGTYTFSLTISTNKNGYLEATITKNTDGVFTALSDSRYNGAYNQGGGTVILKLKQGDIVKVEMRWPDKSVARGKLFSTFSGYMLNAD